MKCIEDEIPFELPDGWAWARLGTIAEVISDGDHQPPPQTSAGIPFLVISNVSSGALSFENTRFVSIEYFNQLPETRRPRNGDLLFTVTGSYGIPVLVDMDDNFCFQRHIAIIRPCVISNRYLHVILGSSYIKTICDDKATGTAQKTVGLATLRELLIPVAPYNEQGQVYTQTQDVLGFVDHISSEKDDLRNIIDRTKSKILDLAIRGHLVSQDPTDEPASVLLERIRSEKEALIKAGKIKRDKKESIIFRGDDNSYYEKLADGSVICIDEELPFAIPDSWSWERLSNIAVVGGGKTPSTAHTEFWNGDIPWITSKDMKSKYVVSSLLKLSDLGAQSMQRYAPNTLLLVTRSGILRHTLPVAILKTEATINQDLKAIELIDSSLAEYLYVCLKGLETSILQKYAKSGTTVENINFDEFKHILLPIPPDAERIRLEGQLAKVTSHIDAISSTLE